MLDKEELQEMYDIKDYILVGTKKIGWEYTDLKSPRDINEKILIKIVY